MDDRRIIIGAIGGDGQELQARRVGAAVARAGFILLTGGEPDRDATADEVKTAAMLGALAEESAGVVPRLIGIIPEKSGWRTQGKSLFLGTARPHNVRNFINGLTPDVLAVFGGSRGTIAEAAFAAAARRPLVFVAGGLDRLRRNFTRYFDSPDASADIGTYLETPLSAFRGVADPTWTPERLLARFAEVLGAAKETAAESPDALVTECARALPAPPGSRPTGFPGLPGDPGSRARFETIVRQLSR